MPSADEKRQQDRLCARRLLIWGSGISLLLHGALWAASQLVPSPLPVSETQVEVTLLLPQAKAPPPLAIKPRLAPRPKRAVRKLVKLVKRPVKNREKAMRKPARRVAMRPAHKTSKAPQVTSQPIASATLNPMRSPQQQRPVTSYNAGKAIANLSPSRAFSRNGLPNSSSPERETEIAALPLGSGTGPTRKTRSGRRPDGGFEVSLPPDAVPMPTQPTGSQTYPGPTGMQGRENDSTFTNSLPDSGRIARGPLAKKPNPSLRPDAHYPTARPEEANDEPDRTNNAPRSLRTARRPRNEDAELFSTKQPQERPDPEPQPETDPERELFRPAKVRSAPKPAYPAEAREKNKEGTVVVRLQISEAGRVINASVVSSSGVPSLDEASLRGVRRWTYEPARRGKIAVASSVTARLTWRLTD